jgi:hypothetical protein
VSEAAPVRFAILLFIVAAGYSLQVGDTTARP